MNKKNETKIENLPDGLKQKRRFTPKTIFIIVLELILLCNIIPYLDFAYKYCKSENQTVNYYMAGALTIDTLYLKPLTRIFGINSPVLKPFSYIQNSLFKKGISYLPQNDAERGMWWYEVKFNPFYQDYISAILNKKESFNFFRKYLDETYKNLLILSQYSLKNERFKVKRYSIFVEKSFAYEYAVMSLYESYDKSLINLYKDKNEIIRTQTIFNKFTDLRKYTDKHEQGGIKYFYIKNSKCRELILVNTISQIIIGNSFYQNKFYCNKYNKTTIKFNIDIAGKLLYSFEHPTLYKLSYCEKEIIRHRLIENAKLLKKIPKTCIAQIK